MTNRKYLSGFGPTNRQRVLILLRAVASAKTKILKAPFYAFSSLKLDTARVFMTRNFWAYEHFYPTNRYRCADYGTHYIVLAYEVRCYREGQLMERRADQYRRLARECLRLVTTTSVSAGRSTLIEMAGMWTRLADEQDQQQRQQFLAVKDAGETPGQAIDIPA
jgi:hypothetical protein